MTAEELGKIIARGEDLRVEFKSDRDKLPDRALVEAVAAMANTDGGLLLQGVEDGTGEITGLHRQHIGCGTPTAMIANRTVPPLPVKVEEIVVDGKYVFAIEVPEVPGVTATSDGLYLRRRLKPNGEPETVPMNPFELQSRMSRFRLIDPSAQAMPEVPLSAIDALQRERMRSSIRRNHNSDKALLELDDAAFDRSLGLVQDYGGRECLSLAGLLCLTDADTIRKFAPTYEVAFQVLKGLNVVVNDYMRKPLVEAFDGIVERFSARIEEEEVMRGGYRMAAPNYDLTAFREALANALVHRDYSVLGAVIVQMDDYGLSIYNPGGFVDGVGIGNILSVAPKSRNSLLADIAKRIGLAERTGRGVDRIFEGVLRYGRHKPGYEKSDAFGVTVVMPKEKADFAFLDMVNEYEKKTGKEMKVDALLTVAELKERGKLSFNEIVALTQRKPETIRGEIEEWIADGLIGKFGKGRSDSYVLDESIRDKIMGKNLANWLGETQKGIKGSQKSDERAENTSKRAEKDMERAEKIRAWALNMIPEGVRQDARSNMVSVVAGIGMDGQITTEGLMHLTGLSDRGVRKTIASLKTLGLLTRVGSDRVGHWELVGFKP